MKIDFELWQLITLMLAFFGAVATGAKVLMVQSQRSIDKQFESLGKRLDGIENTGREETAQWQRVERELLNLKAEMPLHYVRREDYIRGQSVIEAKLDGLALRIQNATLRGGNNVD